MAIGNPVQLGAVSAAAGAATLVLTTTTDGPVGSLIVLGTRTGSAASVLSSVADSAGNTWTVLDAGSSVTNIPGCAYAKNSSVDLPSGGTITATFSGTAGTKSVEAFYITGCDNTAPADAHNQTSSGTATSATSVATGTLAQADEIVLGLAGLGNTSGGFTGDAAFTNIGNTDTTNGGLFAAYKIVASTASQAWVPTWTTSRNYGSNVVSFKGAASVALPAGTLYDLTIPRPARRAAILMDTQQQRAEYILGRETLPKFIPNLDRPQPPARRMDMQRETQAQYVRIVGQESGFTKFVPDLSIPPPVRRQRTLDNPQAQRAEYIPGKETLPGFVPNLDLPAPARRSRTLGDTQQQRAEYVIGRERLPGFAQEWKVPPPKVWPVEVRGFVHDTDIQLIGQDKLPNFNAEWKVPPPARRVRTLEDTQAPIDAPWMIVGQETLPKFAQEWKVPPPLRRVATLADSQSPFYPMLLLTGKDLLPGFMPDLRIPPPAKRLATSELGFIKDLDNQLLGQDQVPYFTADLRAPMRPAFFRELLNGSASVVAIIGPTPGAFTYGVTAGPEISAHTGVTLLNAHGVGGKQSGLSGVEGIPHDAPQ